MKQKKLPRIVVIVGPTAVGKTALSLALAKRFDGEIISADSRQIYRGLDIGTGKVTAEEAGDIPHHLIDIRDPKETYSAAEWKHDAAKAIEGILKRKKLPIIVGGTFFYIEALLGTSLPDVAPNEALRKSLESVSTEELFKQLKKADPARAKDIDAKNRHRLVRALEIIDALGKVPPAKKQAASYDPYIVGVSLPKEALQERIITRLRTRIRDGMVDEARLLKSKGLSFARMDELGLEYRYLAKLLSGEMNDAAMQTKLATEIWHFAKRQLTWLKRMEDVNWYTPGEGEKIERDIEKFLF